jgi:hypothetical protein
MHGVRKGRSVQRTQYWWLNMEEAHLGLQIGSLHSAHRVCWVCILPFSYSSLIQDIIPHPCPTRPYTNQILNTGRARAHTHTHTHTTSRSNVEHLHDLSPFYLVALGHTWAVQVAKFTWTFWGIREEILVRKFSCLVLIWSSTSVMLYSRRKKNY